MSERVVVLCFEEPPESVIARLGPGMTLRLLHGDALLAERAEWWRFFVRPPSVGVAIDWEWDEDGGHATSQEGAIWQLERQLGGVSSRGNFAHVANPLALLDLARLSEALLADEPAAHALIVCARSIRLPHIDAMRSVVASAFSRADGTAQQLAVARALVVLGHFRALLMLEAANRTELAPAIAELRRIREANDFS